MIYHSYCLTFYVNRTGVLLGGGGGGGGFVGLKLQNASYLPLNNGLDIVS